MTNQANDLYWVSQQIADMSKELSTPDAEQEFTAENFDRLYAYVHHYCNPQGMVSGGLVFRMNDGRRLDVNIQLTIDDSE